MAMPTTQRLGVALVAACLSLLLARTTGAEADAVTHAWVASLGKGVLKDIKYSHMATIAALPGGVLAAAFQCTSSIEGAADQHIRFTTSTDQGVSWGDALVIAGSPSAGPPVWGPVLFWDELGGQLNLFYSRSQNGTEHDVGGDLRVIHSENTGATWSSPRVIMPLGDQSKVTANPVAIVGGRWLLPIWYEGSPPKGAASVLASDDGGKIWSPHGFIHGTRKKENDTKLIENTLALMPDGKVLQLFRAGKGTLFESVSADDAGLLWSAAVPSTIPNPSAKVSLLRRNDTGSLVLSYNPSVKLRSPLALAESTSGKAGSFKHLATLEDNDKKSFGYPTSVHVGSKIHTVYSVYDPHSTAPHTHHWWGIRIATTDLTSNVK